MKEIALRRLRSIAVFKGPGLTAKQRLILHSELAAMGYRLKNTQLLENAAATLLLDYPLIIKTLRKMRGGDVDYVPLFSGFPDEVPDDDIYFIKRLIGLVANDLDLYPEGKRLENGVVVPDWLFDLKDFGADPITQLQSTELTRRGKEKQDRRKSDTHTEWIDITLVSAKEMTEDLKLFLKQQLYSKSSIKEALHNDLATLLKYLGCEHLDPTEIVVKENLALLLRLLWQAEDFEDVARLAKTPTDLLRLFAALTDTDISLSQKIRFPKFSRAQRRTVLGILEDAPALREDLQRYRGLWLELGRYLHPTEYAKRFPKTADAFDALRNGKIETFASRTEALLKAGEADEAIKHLKTRPGVLGRKIHELLRRFPTYNQDILKALIQLTGKMPLKNLLVLSSYFSTINEREQRTVINKRGKVVVIANNAKGALSTSQIGDLQGLLDGAIGAKLKERESWQDKTVWISPELDHYTVPLQQRAASDGLLTLGRGTHLTVDFTPVLRLFVYWKQQDKRTDLDLSLISFAEDFDYQGHVSYTNLKSTGIAHSGDLQSAPDGAAEFIDVTLKALPEGTRYLAPQVYRYCGEHFSEMVCHAGWMLRKKVSADYKTFDIKTVANKFDLNGKNAYAVPFLVDLKEKKIIWLDLYVSGKSLHNRIEGAVGNIALICQEVSDFVLTRPTMAQLAKHHVHARGGKAVDSRSQADITMGVRDCTYNATDVGQILSELL
jgi:hypothetical protein